MYALAVPTTAPGLIYNPYSFAVHDDAYDTYRRLRDEAPAFWNPELRFWALSRFTDVLEGSATSRPTRQREASRSRTAARSARRCPTSSR